MNSIATYDPQQNGLSVIGAMARDYGMRADAFEQTLRKTVVPSACTREEFAAFVLVAKHYELNPITKEIYALPKKGGGIQPVVGVDGWYGIMNKHPQFDGIEFEDHFDEAGKIAAITARVYRKDRSRPIAVREYLSECTQGTEPWRKWPYRMLRHKAAIQAARLAFGFAGIVDPDEAERFTVPMEQERVQQRPPVRQLQVAADRIIDDEIPEFPERQPDPAPKPARKRRTPSERLAEVDGRAAGNASPAQSVATDGPSTQDASAPHAGTTEDDSQDRVGYDQPADGIDEDHGDAFEPDPEADAYRLGWEASMHGTKRLPPRTLNQQEHVAAWLAGHDHAAQTIQLGNRPVDANANELMRERSLARHFAG